jgi:AraC-like DNA-binding protein
MLISLMETDHPLGYPGFVHGGDEWPKQSMPTKHVTRLYERAAASRDECVSLWHVGDDLALFAGPLGRNALHAHSAAVFLAGLYDSFRLRIDGGDWQSCRAAVVPPGVAYEFDLGGAPLGVLYLEPNVGRAEVLAPLMRSAREANGALVANSGEVLYLRDLYESREEQRRIGAALDDLVRFSKRRECREIDPRIARIVEDLQSDYESTRPVAELARSVGLSASRLQHLFVLEAGVPLRRYRTWHRLRAAIREIVGGATFTQAAQAAGFYDQAHFARAFRQTFGAPASRGIAGLRI